MRHGRGAQAFNERIRRAFNERIRKVNRPREAARAGVGLTGIAAAPPMTEISSPDEAAAAKPSLRAFRGGKAGDGQWAWFVAPSLIMVVIFFVAPFLLTAVLSFTRWTSFSSKISFIGLSNFSDLIHQDVMVPAIQATLTYAVIVMVVQNVVSLSLALLMQKTDAMNSMFRALYFIPVLISPVAAGYIWAAIVNPGGPVNQFINLFVGPGFAFPWLATPGSAIVVVSIIDAWKWSGFFTLIYIAGLNSIPKELIDAGRIDGATAWQRFWKIQFPLLAPAFTFNVVVTLIGAFGAYDVILATTTGGPGNATTVLNIALWRQWSQGMFGTASALGFTVTLMVIFGAVPLVWWLRRREVTL